MTKAWLGVFAVAAICISSNVAKASNEQLEYGKYLSGECTACHRDGSNETIPPIVGWDPEAFVAVMESYKKAERDNKAMVSVAQSLDADQIKALAAYFATIKPKNP